MNALLMNKNTPTIEVTLDDITGRLINITKELNPEFLPVVIRQSKSPKIAFEDWLRHRSISNTRTELQELLQAAGVSTASALSLKNLGLNLSDQYWFKPFDSTLTWNDVNFFQNDFVSDTSQQKFSELDITTYSPNASSNGELHKFWLIRDNKRYLYKDSTRPYFQQASNEVFASKLLSQLDIPHVPYTLEVFQGKTYSSCETFIKDSTEYVPALYILEAVDKKQSENAFSHFLRCVDKLNIPCSTQDIQRILAFDFIINNEDRHYGNFGFIRNVETLEYQGLAPIFDNGNSLWYMSSLKGIKSSDNFSSEKNAKPFKNTHVEQSKLITSSCIDISKIQKIDIKKLAYECFSTNKEFEDSRIDKISETVYSHMQSLEKKLRQTNELEL